MDSSADLPRLTLRRDLLADGWSSSEVQHQRHTGALRSIRRGSYLVAPSHLPRSAERRHRVQIDAVLPHLAPGWVVSHVSAAVLHGLPIWKIPLDRVHVSRDGSGGARVTRVVHRHVGPLSDAEVVDVDGVPVTDLGRTVCDVARAAPFEQALVVADAALATRKLTAESLRAAVAPIAATRGGPKAVRVVESADGGAQSPGETLSRLAIQRAGLPRPVLQFEVGTDGRFIGFADFGWEELRTVGEFDGKVKYGRLLLPGQDAGDAVHAEKLREDAIRATGLAVVRWTWAEIFRFAPVAARIRRQFRE